MLKKDFAVLNDNFSKAFHEYNAYMEQFFTSSVNDIITNEAIKTFTKEEIEKTQQMKKTLEELEKQWFSAAIEEIKIID